ncbi:MAG: hypothetical protein O3A36_00470 [bacterium]|nr:hypothetical protein [bacterium]
MEYKPNIYPIMYWALVYGIIAATALLAVHLLAGFISLLWFPVFLAGLVWGGYRKYQRDKAAWAQSNGSPATPTSGKQKTPVEEFKDAARDIAQASREMMARQATEDAATEQVEQEIITEVPETAPEEDQVPPQSPLQPLV